MKEKFRNNKILYKFFFSLLIITILTGISYFSENMFFLWSSIFFIALGLLIKSSDIFTEYAEQLGMVMGIPQFIIGVTIVSIGTSLPELITSIIAVLKGTTEFVAGNAIGSNIANILFVVGLAAIFAKKVMKVEWSLIDVDLPLLLIASFILFFTINDGLFTFGEAIICILGYIIYMVYVINQKSDEAKEDRPNFQWKMIGMLSISAIGIFYGAKYTIDAIIAIVKNPIFINMGIDTSMIALSAVAIGTSLPELMVSVSAARKGNYEIALGNIIGSNIFNSFMVMGIPALIAPLIVPANIITLAMPFMIVATLIFTVSILDKSISKFEGAGFLLLYLLFIGKLFGLI